MQFMYTGLLPYRGLQSSLDGWFLLCYCNRRVAYMAITELKKSVTFTRKSALT